MDATAEIVRRLYEGFNRRDIPSVLQLLTDDIAWANGLEGGHVHGHDALREYWTRQWAMIDPVVTPLAMRRDGTGRIGVEVHQTVHALDGRLLLDEQVRHVFTIENGLVTRFDIEEAGDLASIAHQ